MKKKLIQIDSIPNKVNKRYLFVYMVLYVLPLFVNFLWLILLREYRSEFPTKAIQVTLNNSVIFVNFFFTMVYMLVLLFIFLELQKKQFIVSKNINVYFVKNKLDIFILFILMLKFLFYLKTGIGKAGNDNSGNKFSTLINLINIDSLILIYYISYRKEAGKKFIINIIVYILYQFAKGWSGIVLTVALIEIYIRTETKSFIKYLLLLPLLFIIGASVYQFLYPIKMFIRLGVYESITYSEAIIKLFERLSWFSHSCVAIQNSDKMVELYRETGNSLTEIKAFWKPIIPSFIMKNKDFRSLNNLIMMSVYPEYGKTTSSNFGGLCYLLILSRIGKLDILLYFIGIILNTFFYKFFIDLVRPAENDTSARYSNFLLFSYFTAIFSVGALENISYGWVSIIWTYVILWMTGAIKIRITRRYYVNNKCV